jgi:hypothetical protein
MFDFTSEATWAWIISFTVLIVISFIHLINTGPFGLFFLLVSFGRQLSFKELMQTIEVVKFVDIQLSQNCFIIFLMSTGTTVMSLLHFYINNFWFSYFVSYANNLPILLIFSRKYFWCSLIFSIDFFLQFHWVLLFYYFSSTYFEFNLPFFSCFLKTEA